MAKKPPPQKPIPTPEHSPENSQPIEKIELVKGEFRNYPRLIVPNSEDVAELYRLRDEYGISDVYFKAFLLYQTMCRMTGFKTAEAVSRLDNLTNWVDNVNGKSDTNHKLRHVQILGYINQSLVPVVKYLYSNSKKWLPNKSGGVSGLSGLVDKSGIACLSFSPLHTAHNAIQLLKHIGIFINKVFPENIYGYGKAPLYYPSFIAGKKTTPTRQEVIKPIGDAIKDIFEEIMRERNSGIIRPKYNANDSKKQVMVFRFDENDEHVTKIYSIFHNKIFIKPLPKKERILYEKIAIAELARISKLKK